MQQQIKELAGMFAVVLEQEEADGTKRVHATLPANICKVGDRYPPHRVSISHLAVRRECGTHALGGIDQRYALLG